MDQEPRIPLLVAVAGVGLLLGSFLNVLIHRLPRHMSILGFSKCTKCLTTIAPLDNVPVFSFVFLRGRCRHCGETISWRYPIVEILGSLLALACWVRFADVSDFCFATLFAYGLLTAAVTDLERGVVPDTVTLSIVLVGLVKSGLAGTLLEFMVGTVVAGGTLLFVATLYRVVRRRYGLGMGDVKLIAGVGGYLGWERALYTVLIASVTALIGVAPLLALGRMGTTTKFPFAPFLAVGALASLLLL